MQLISGVLVSPSMKKTKGPCFELALLDPAVLCVSSIFYCKTPQDQAFISVFICPAIPDTVADKWALSKYNAINHSLFSQKGCLARGEKYPVHCQGRQII